MARRAGPIKIEDGVKPAARPLRETADALGQQAASAPDLGECATVLQPTEQSTSAYASGRS
jgi:hypothetical protein